MSRLFIENSTGSCSLKAACFLAVRHKPLRALKYNVCVHRKKFVLRKKKHFHNSPGTSLIYPCLSEIKVQRKTSLLNLHYCQLLTACGNVVNNFSMKAAKKVCYVYPLCMDKCLSVITFICIHLKMKKYHVCLLIYLCVS